MTVGMTYFISTLIWIAIVAFIFRAVFIRSKGK